METPESWAEVIFENLKGFQKGQDTTTEQITSHGPLVSKKQVVLAQELQNQEPDLNHIFTVLVDADSSGLSDDPWE